ncbi:RagB/SusD family nutrient uptake outer membrane protein [Mesonia maritima]
MKKILIFIIGISLFSCQDAIDIEQAGELTEDVAIENVTDMQNNLNFVYSAVNNSTQISLSSIWTDEVGIGFANGGQGLDGDYLFQMNAGSNFASGIWNSSYDLINFANRLIKSSESISPEEGEEEQAYLNILAQARALRAWAHFQLLTYFSEDITDDNSAGVLLVDFVPKTNDNLPRSSTGEVFDFIIKDLDFAETNLSETMTNPIYLSQDFITAFRARMALYRENYTEAQGYAQQLIDQIPLSQPSTYRDIWRDEAAGEVI